jgi:hypothetical protein
MQQENEPYTYRRTGTCGCELLSPEGQVFAWTVDASWAGLVIGLLNAAEENGLPRPAQCHRFDSGIGPVEATTADDSLS